MEDIPTPKRMETSLSETLPTKDDLSMDEDEDKNKNDDDDDDDIDGALVKVSTIKPIRRKNLS